MFLQIDLIDHPNDSNFSHDVDFVLIFLILMLNFYVICVVHGDIFFRTKDHHHGVTSYINHFSDAIFDFRYTVVPSSNSKHVIFLVRQFSDFYDQYFLVTNNCLIFYNWIHSLSYVDCHLPICTNFGHNNWVVFIEQDGMFYVEDTVEIIIVDFVNNVCLVLVDVVEDTT